MIRNDRAAGTISVAVAYAFWGLLTLFWNLLVEVDSVYILSQRIIWSMVFMGLFILATKNTAEIRSIFRSRHSLIICFISGVLVTINWGSYIIAVNGGHVLDASLGYFIEPLLVSLIGIIFFKERLSKYEKITLFFSVVGLVYMIAVTKIVPTMALVIAGSFALYGGVKKQIEISPHASLFMETLLMTPFALAFALFCDSHGCGGLAVLNGAALLLFPACGIITSVPLFLFNIGVKKIPYYISGILMYINPTLQFLMGTFYFNEPMDIHRLIAFLFIWFGILFTLYEKINMIRKEKEKPTE